MPVVGEVEVGVVGVDEREGHLARDHGGPSAVSGGLAGQRPDQGAAESPHEESDEED